MLTQEDVDFIDANLGVYLYDNREWMCRKAFGVYQRKWWDNENWITCTAHDLFLDLKFVNDSVNNFKKVKTPCESALIKWLRK